MLDLEYIAQNITTDDGVPVPYRWSHGATDKHLGDGLIIYALIQYMRAKECVCLGSGGGFIPRIMTQARKDLWEQGIFEGKDWNSWGDIGNTYIVDACNGVGGEVSWADRDSFFRTRFEPRFIKDTTENAYYNFFVLQDIKIDYLHIDAGHSFEDVKRDFELYSNLLSEKGVITIHDTDPNYEESLIVSEDNRDSWDRFDGPGRFIQELKKSGAWNVLDLHNFGILSEKPASTGITLVVRNQTSKSKSIDII